MSQNGTADPRKDFGAQAIEMGFCTQAQIEDARATVQELQKLGLPETLSSILVRKGYLKSEQAAAVERALSGPPVLAGYEILEKVGQGGMGAVFRARQITMDRIVALKILPRRYAQDPVFKERFLREARMCAKLNHINLINAIDCGEASGHTYFAMEFVDGQTGGQLLQQVGKLSPDRALHIVRQIGDALAYAHSKQLIHRDVKPDNIMITPDGVAKLCDLGLARSVQRDDASLTRAGQTLGTPYYIAPEQALGKGDVDARADIYALGATFYHFLTGKTLFDGATAAAIMTQHVTGTAPAVTELASAVPPEYARIVAQMVAKAPGDRYPNAEALIRDLDAAKAGSVTSAAQFQAPSSCGLPSRTARLQRRGAMTTAPRTAIGPREPGAGSARPPSRSLHPLLVGGAVGGVILVAGFGIFQLTRGKEPPPERRAKASEPVAAPKPPSPKVEAPKPAPPPQEPEPPRNPEPAPVTPKAEPAVAPAPNPNPAPDPNPAAVAPPVPPPVEPEPEKAAEPPPAPDVVPGLHVRFLAEMSKLAQKNDLAKVETELRVLAAKPEFAPAKERLSADLKDLGLAAQLEQDAMKALGAGKGELDLPADLAKTFKIAKGQVERYDAGRGLSITAVGGGVGLYIAAAQLPPALLAKAAGVNGREPAAGMMYLARGAYEDARGLLPNLSEADRARLEQRLEYLKAGEAEVAARTAWQELAGLAQARQWKMFLDKLAVFEKQHGGSAAATEHAADLAAFKGSAQVALNPLRKLFHAASVKQLPNGCVEVVYDFSTPEQAMDFGCEHGKLTVANGELVVPPGRLEYAYARFLAPIAELRRLEVTMRNPSGQERTGIGLFAVGQTDGDQSPKCILRPYDSRAHLECWDPPYAPGARGGQTNAIGPVATDWRRPVAFLVEGDGEDFIWYLDGNSIGQSRLPKAYVGANIAFFGVGGMHAWSKLRIVFKPTPEFLAPRPTKP